MKIFIKSSIIFSVCFLLVSCKTQNIFSETTYIENQEGQNNNDFVYKIRKNDKVTLSVWGQDDLSVGSVFGIYNSNEIYGKWLLVDGNGNIELPRLGTTNVLGKTVPELKEEIKTKLKKWLVNPIVDIKILNKEITILGEVKNPSTILVDKDQISLLDIISKAGGLDFYANIKKVKILRQENENVRITNVDLTKMNEFTLKNIELHPGDYILVPSKKSKDFEKRISTIIPFTNTASAAVLLMGAF